MDCIYRIGDRVKKTGGDYTFEGNVVAVFAKRSGLIRLVVEDDRGLLFIFNPSQLQLVMFNQSPPKEEVIPCFP